MQESMKAMTYFELIRTVDNQVPPYVSFLLMLKLDMTENAFFYFISFFLRFNGILIICSKFPLSLDEVKNNKSIATYLRWLTVDSIKALLKTNHITYIAASLIFFALFCIRMIIYYLTINQLKNSTNLEKIKLNRYQVFMDHVVFLFYPILLEYLSQMHLRFIFPSYYTYGLEKYLIPDIIILLVNTLLIIGYNINNYYHLHVINRPTSAGNVPVRYRYSKKKFWVIFLLQNLACIQNIDNYLTSDIQIKYYTIAVSIIFCVILVLFFITSLAAFNYDVLTNHFLAIMCNYCFFSLFSEAILRLFGYNITTNYTLIMFNIVKILISIKFVMINNRLSDVKLLSLAKKELFKIYSSKIDNGGIYNVFLYIYEILKKIKNNIDNIATSTLINIIIEHQNSCSTKACKCKLIQVIPDGEQYTENFTYNFIQRISFFIEMAFIEVDYSSDYHLTLMLSEHFCWFKNNFIMAYSLLQTLIQFNIKKLGMSELLIIYETCQKYVSIANEMNILSALSNDDRNLILKERLFKQTFTLYNTIHDVQTIMIKYCNREIEIAKYKELFEESVKIQRNEETGEVYSININFLNAENLDKIIILLKEEAELNKKVNDKIRSIKSKLPIEFYYKCFLFYKTFLEGKLDEKIVSILYSFTNDRNLYSTKINPNIFILLRQRYIESINKNSTIYYCIFNFSKGILIDFYNETLAYKLGYSNDELIGQNIDILVPKQIAKSHNSAISHYLISKQNRIIDFKNSMFKKNGLMIESKMNGTSLPGLGKNLLTIMGIKIIQNDNLRFYFTQNFELLSLSESFYDKFFFDMNIIEKFNLNIFNIFGMDPKNIKEKFLNFQSDIRKLKFNLNISTDEFFMKKLYKQSFTSKYQLIKELENQHKEESAKLNKNQQIMEDMKECLNNIFNNQLKDKIKSRPFKYKISKSEIIKNFNKILNEKNYDELNDKGYKKTTDFFTNLQTMFINETESLYNSYYEITIQCRLIYDDPIFYVNIIEYKNFDVNEFINNQNTNLNISFGKNNFINNNNNSINMNSFSMSNTRTQNTLTTINNGNIKIFLGPKTDENNSHLLLYTRNIIYCLITILLIVYITILLYQFSFINNCYTIFLAYFYNWIQKNKGINLYSTLLFNYYRETNLIDLNIITNESVFMDYIITSAKEFESAYHEFYQNYMKYHFSLRKPMTFFYTQFNVSRITVNWDVKNKTTIFMQSTESIAHSTITFAQEKISKQKLKQDLDIFFNGAYKKDENKKLPIYSTFIFTLFYFCENFQNVIYKFINLIEDEIMDSYDDYAKQSKIINIFIETLGFIVNTTFCIVVFTFLVMINRIIFRNIVELFIDYTQYDNYSFKNNLDNFLIIEKMNELKYLIFNFNIKSLDKYNKKLSDESLKLLECNDGKSINSIEKMNDNSPSRNNISKNVINDKKIINNNKISKKTTTMKKESKKSLVSDSNSTALANINKTDMSSSLVNTFSRTDEKLININNYNSNNLNLISNLNKKITPGNNIQSSNNTRNTNTKNSLIGGNSLSANSLNVQNNKKENDFISLTANKIAEKSVVNKINFLKLNMIIIVGIIVSLLIFYIVKIIITLNFVKSTTVIFDDYGTLTNRFGSAVDYFNNFCLLLINKNLVNISYFDNMLEKTVEINSKINEMKKGRLSSYPTSFKMINILNSKQNIVNSDGTSLENSLCKNSIPCHNVIQNKNLTMVTNGVSLGVLSVIQEIDKLVNDYKKINKNELTDIANVKKNFINIQFNQIIFNLNFVLSTTMDRVDEVFLDDIRNIAGKNKSTIIFSNIIIIFYLTGVFLYIIFMISKTFKSLKLIELSIFRLNKVFNSIKKVNKRS